jgi:hypothetical protein
MQIFYGKKYNREFIKVTTENGNFSFRCKKKRFRSALRRPSGRGWAYTTIQSRPILEPESILIDYEIRERVSEDDIKSLNPKFYLLEFDGNKRKIILEERNQKGETYIHTEIRISDVKYWIEQPIREKVDISF